MKEREAREKNVINGLAIQQNVSVGGIAWRELGYPLSAFRTKDLVGNIDRLVTRHADKGNPALAGRGR